MCNASPKKSLSDGPGVYLRGDSVQGIPKKLTFRMLLEPRCTSSRHLVQPDFDEPVSGVCFSGRFFLGLSRIKSIAKFGPVCSTQFWLGFSGFSSILQVTFFGRPSSSHKIGSPSEAILTVACLLADTCLEPLFRIGDLPSSQKVGKQYLTTQSSILRPKRAAKSKTDKAGWKKYTATKGKVVRSSEYIVFFQW